MVNPMNIKIQKCGDYLMVNLIILMLNDFFQFFISIVNNTIFYNFFKFNKKNIKINFTENQMDYKDLPEFDDHENYEKRNQDLLESE